MISNYGRLWHKYLGIFLKIQLQEDGYWNYLFARKKDKPKIGRIHRIVMLEFNYIPGCEELFVNHIDGNPSNNMITNLEWCTPAENSYHAVHVLGKKTMPKSIELIENICRDLENPNLSKVDIAKKNNVKYSYVKAISQKIISKDICDNYNFASRIKNNLSTKEIKEICKYFSENCHNNLSKKQCDEIINIIGHNIHDRNIRVTVREIYNRRSYKHISKDYDW